MFTHPHKLVYFFALGVVLLAGVGADALRRGLNARARVVWIVLGTVVLLVVPFDVPQRALGTALLLGVALCAAPAPAAALRAMPVLVALATLAAYHVHAQRPSDNLNYLARYDDVYRELARRQDAGRTFVLTDDFYGSPRQGEIAGVAQVTTNGTFLRERLDRLQRATREAVRTGQHERTVALLRATGSHFVLTGRDELGWLGDGGLDKVIQGRNADVWEDQRALPRAYLAGRSVVEPAGQALERLAAPDLATSRGVVLESEDGPVPAAAASGDAGSARVVEASPSIVRIAVDATRPAVLVLLDAWSTEWPATLDGAPVVTRHANLVGRAVEVPAGAHEVVFRFVPRALYAGAATSALALVVLVAALSAGRRRRHQAAPTTALTSRA
jgi:hypothetical protein